MTQTPHLPVQPGDVIHFLVTGLSVFDFPGRGHVARQGDELTITPELITASWDGSNHSWLELADNPAAQLARYGAVHFGIGPYPANTDD
ncbi:hypothetical protein E3T23_06590 [Cryobacterium cheniae]|uniref:Uncharacterized protein n=1 Tax=Cryobacterium cheniae TaxID=1259262 RepID=A0A4R8XUT1_9MICO|nr:hypothetical protein [Cryobacterium cheniae]TFC81160.1 hypothetical protein E3T23_06590 [Cryobacterium cheniae]